MLIKSFKIMTKINNIEDSDRQILIQICRQFLGETWNNDKQINIKTFDDGLVNQVYLCQLSENIINETRITSQEPNSVVIRLMSKEATFLYKPSLATLNTYLIAEKNIAPKVLGIFSNGFVQQYIDGRKYNFMDDYNDNTVRLLAQKLAAIHALNLPIAKDSTAFFHEQLFRAFTYNHEFIHDYRNGKIRKYCEYYNMETLSSVDLIDELNWIENRVIDSKSPLVFSHCDFNRSNILIRNTKKPSLAASDMFVIDFDYSCYCYRGVDIGRYFANWRMKDQFESGEFPTDDQMSVFIDAYLDAGAEIVGHHYWNSDRNTIKSLIQESKLFALLGYMFDVLYCVHCVCYNEDRLQIEEFMKKGETRYNGYVQLKEKFLKENSI